MTPSTSFSYLCLLVLSIASANSVASKNVCRALALSGGGNKGSYEAGAIHGLVNGLEPKDVEYDVVTGVSVGAINAAGVSLWPIGQEL